MDNNQVPVSINFVMTHLAIKMVLGFAVGYITGKVYDKVVLEPIIKARN
jgi:uncharacterized membrane protein (Fun14 family)